MTDIPPVNLTVVRTPPDVNEDLVEALARYKDMAERGELRSAVLVGSLRDGDTLTYRSWTSNAIAEIGSVARLLYYMNKQSDEATQDEGAPT